MANVEFALRRQAEAAKELLLDLMRDGAGDDAELVADAIEGETDLHEAITAALEEIDECDVIEAGCKTKAAEYQERGSTAARRRDRIRSMIERAMVAVEITEPLRLSGATLSITRRKPQPVIEDEALIPSRFFVQPPPPPPKIDKKALAEALAADEAVPGARLDNGSISLTVRRK
jgi:hypothetical protein